jgi:phage shock protein A
MAGPSIPGIGPSQSESYSEVSFVSKPNPDPTERTEAQLHRQIGSLQEKLSISISGLQQLIFERIEGKVGTLVAMMDGNRKATESKFEGVDKQFIDLDVRTERNAALAKEAVAAALQAQKESVGAQNISIAQSNEKMETSFTKQIDQQAASIKTVEKTGDDKVDDLKDRMASLDSRIQAIESRKEGVVEQRIGTSSAVSLVIAATGIVAGIAIALMSHYK